MKKFLRRISPAMYALILVAFFMPFVEVSCSGQQVVTLTGFQMVTGTSIEQPRIIREQPTVRREIPREPMAIAAFVIAVLGLGVSFAASRAGRVGSLLAAVGGTVALLLLKSRLDNEALREGGGMIQLVYAYGYWGALGLCLLLIAVNAYLLADGGGGARPGD